METVHSADGTTIAVERVGDGPPLVLVVGAFCDRGTLRGLAEMLSGHLAVLTYDRRGRGASGDTPPYSVDRELEDLDAVISEAGGAAFVYGHSSGAILSLEAAARGLPVTKLAAYEPPYIADDTRSRPQQLTERVTALVESGHRGDAVETFLLEGPAAPPEVIAGMKAGPAWPALEAVAHTLPYDLAICGDQVVPEARLARVAVPTLMLSGGASAEWMRNAAAACAAAIPGAHNTVLDGQTHGVADEAVAPVLLQFFLS
jgi:pimeloyl-ACP methyl ester carboxylesterase